MDFKMKTVFILIFFIIFGFSHFTSKAQSWQEMNDSSLAYRENGEYDIALKWAQQALSQAEIEFGKNDTNYVFTLGTIAEMYFLQSNFDSSIYYGNMWLSLSREIYKTDHPQLAKSISWMSYFYNTVGDYQNAEPLAIESLEMTKRIYKTDHPDIAVDILNLAVFYSSMGNFSKAEKYFNESLEMNRRLFNTDHQNLAICINYLANFYNTRGDYNKAEQFYTESLEMYRRLFKTDHPDLAFSMIGMAEIYNFRGDFNKAEQLYIEALEMVRRIFITDNPQLAFSISSTANFYTSRGDYKKAEPLYIESLAMIRRLYNTDHPEIAITLNNMAGFYTEISNYTKAEPLYLESLEMYRRIYKTDHPDLGMIINNTGQFYLSINELKKAEQYLIEALEMSRRIFTTDNPNLAMIINNVSIIYSKNGDSAKAESLQIEALEMKRRLFKTDHPDLAMSIQNLAVFYHERGNTAKAEPLFIEALDMHRSVFKGDHPDLANTLKWMAAFYNGMGRYAEAEPFLIEALKVYQNMLNNYFPSLSEKEKKQFWKTVSNTFEQFNKFGVDRYSANPSISCNMYDIQLYTKGLLFNSTSKIKNRIMNSKDSVLIENFKELTDKKELLVKLYSMTQNERIKKGFNLDSIEKVTNDLEKKLSLKSELFTQSYEKKKVNWKSIQTLLKPDEAAVEVIRFSYKDKKSLADTINYAFLIVTDQSEEHPELVLIKDGNKLENEYYKEYRQNIKNKKKDLKSFSRYWGQLHEKLKGYKKIFFSADGIYNKLNPSTFMKPDGKFMLEEQDIQQINSTKDILIGFYQTKQESNIYNSAVLIGNPNFSLSESMVRETSKKIKGQSSDDKDEELVASIRGIELNRLPGTEKEIKDIEKFLKDKRWEIKSYLGDMALKTAVKTATNPRVLHIATHGMFLEDVKLDNKETFGFETQKVVENPLLRSGLFFTGADNYIKSDIEKPTGDENGLLTAYEAMNLNLDKTELVVLSACETGLGDVQNGEGVFGLRRAFQQAGAKTIVMSLWSVSDKATQELMSEFYGNWVGGMTKREAFNKAQLDIKAKYDDPYFWGAFVMVGE